VSICHGGPQRCTGVGMHSVINNIGGSGSWLITVTYRLTWRKLVVWTSLSVCVICTTVSQHFNWYGASRGSLSYSGASCTITLVVVHSVKLRQCALLVGDREQYEVILQSPLSRVTASELTQADVEKRFPHGTPSEFNHLFLVAIWKETETVEYIFACKQRFDNWYVMFVICGNS